MKRLTTKEFIKKAEKVHGDNYDYSQVDYINNKKNVIIICEKHGNFNQLPSHHLSGKGCRVCGYEKVAVGQSDNLNSFLNKTVEVHNNRYDYSKVNYISSSKKVNIICPEHGQFEQTPNKHLLGQGCRKCGYKNMLGVPKELHNRMKELKTAVSAVYYRGVYTEYSMIYSILGCTWEVFKEHLNNNEFGFKVGDEGLDLDHIVPISRAKNESDLIRLTHYSNFQLLPAYYNRYVKKDKDFNINELREWLTN